MNVSVSKIRRYFQVGHVTRLCLHWIRSCARRRKAMQSTLCATQIVFPLISNNFDSFNSCLSIKKYQPDYDKVDTKIFLSGTGLLSMLGGRLPIDFFKLTFVIEVSKVLPIDVDISTWPLKFQIRLLSPALLFSS